MRLHRRGVDKDFHGRPAGLRERVEHLDPDTLGRPADIAVVERFLRTVFRRRVDPAPARLDNMDDAADDPAVVDARLAARIRRQMWRDL